jgi:hypothetical protein
MPLWVGLLLTAVGVILVTLTVIAYLTLEALDNIEFYITRRSDDVIPSTSLLDKVVGEALAKRVPGQIMFNPPEHMKVGVMSGLRCVLLRVSLRTYVWGFEGAANFRLKISWQAPSWQCTCQEKASTLQGWGMRNK